MKDVNPGKRAHSEEKDLDASLEQREGESFVAKRLCVNKDRDEHHLEKTVDIPLLVCIPKCSLLFLKGTKNP